MNEGSASMNTSKNQVINIGYYLGLISRRRWFIILPFCLAIIVGSVLAVKLPKLYEASTLILIQPQGVPEKLVQPVVTGGLDTRINNISQQITSRSNLEKVVERLRFSSGPKFQEALLDDQISEMRGRIRVEIGRDKGRKQKTVGGDAFTIAYQDPDPRVAMLVVNALANAFMDENLKMRESRAVGTSDFLEAELESSRKRLEALEQDLKEYRQRYMGELPEQLETNLRMIDRLNATLNEKERNLQNARVNLVAIENELSMRQNAVAASAPSEATPNDRVPEELMSVAQLKERLAGLMASYTDQHPDVVRLKAKIEKLEAGGRTTTTSAVSAKSGDVGLSATAVRQTTVLYGTIRTLELEIVSLNKEIREYQRRVEAAPKREIEMLSLRRDYDNMKASYNSLLNRRLEAEISVNLEKKQKGEQFQVIEPAVVPSIPAFPDLRKLFLITVFAGIALGGGLVFLIEMSDSSIRKREDLEEKFGLAILATVPRIFDDRDVSRHRIRAVATAASVFLAIVLTAGFASLSFIGVEKTMHLIGLYG